jgi:hypothetical protein
LFPNTEALGAKIRASGKTSPRKKSKTAEHSNQKNNSQLKVREALREWLHD